jgi:hypothetical protein
MMPGTKGILVTKGIVKPRATRLIYNDFRWYFKECFIINPSYLYRNIKERITRALNGTYDW